MADTDAEIKALTGSIEKLERVVSANTAAVSNNTAPSPGQGAAPAMGAYQGGSPTPPRFSNYQDRSQFAKALGSFAGAAGGLAGAVSMALPTTQEAVDMQALAARMRFYGGGTGYAQRGKMGGAYQSDAAAMSAQLAASLQGTALSPEDAAQAVNAASQRGLLPGLPNFGAGKGHQGILGSAALASNLAPGLGITGGVGVMASLNSPQMINMARMFGIQFRNKEGTGMIDLAQIIEQLYNILSKAGPVTKENIAISVMPGNSLDSILNQYFGLDPNLRNVIISGLIQKASGEGMSKAALQKTGGLTSGISSTAMRASNEMNILQQFSGSTVKNLIGSNNFLNKLYGDLVDTAGDQVKNPSNAGKLIRRIQNFSTNVETLAGARGGAGQLVIDSLFDAAKGTVDTANAAGAGLLGKAGALVGGLYAANKLSSVGLGQGTTVNNPFSGSDMYQAGVKASNPGQLFTGAITINVSAPLGQDPYAFASAITKSLSAAM